jgi:hypothetical protein
MTMTLIETKTLGADAASIEFTSIPQDGTDLLVLYSGRTNRNTNSDAVRIAFNGSTAGFTARELFGNGATVASGTDTNAGGGVTGATSTANTFGNTQIYIPNYTGSTNKSFSIDHVTENNGTTAIQDIIAVLWSNTAAITSITFTLFVGPNYLAGTTFSLYKITKGSDGIVTTS